MPARSRSLLPLRALLLPSAIIVAAVLGACHGCRSSSDPAIGAATIPNAGPPTVRLYLLSSVAGALEPCGCSKDQLGGFDHLASLLGAQHEAAPNMVVAAAGPLFFLDPSPRVDNATQDVWKAEAIASSLGRLPFAGWAPGANDWASGSKTLAELREKSGGALLGANLTGDAPGSAPVSIREVGGYRVGFIGISSPLKMGLPPTGVEVKAARDALRPAIDEAKQQGAQILVGLFAMPRGEALRLAETAPELHVVAIGKPFDQGEANDKPAPPSLLGQTLVVETANHLQTVAVVDLHVRDGQFSFQDAAGIARESDRDSLTKRIDELEKKIRAWEQNPQVKASDLNARRDDLAKQRASLRLLETPAPPQSGSFFRYTMMPVKQDAGRDDATFQTMLAYYQKVNEHNRIAFADRKPQPPGPDGNRFVGVDACSQCHPGAREFWNKTAHARAYKTLSDQHKEFNLDCVSCHVTGYEKPGGSTVTFNDGLRDVQCENCHGPGDKHRQNPADKSLIIASPKPETCVSSCHHPPHVDGFDPKAHSAAILGPGHGNPDAWKAKPLPSLAAELANLPVPGRRRWNHRSCEGCLFATAATPSRTCLCATRHRQVSRAQGVTPPDRGHGHAHASRGHQSVLTGVALPLARAPNHQNGRRAHPLRGFRAPPGRRPLPSRRFDGAWRLTATPLAEVRWRSAADGHSPCGGSMALGG